MAKRKPKTPPDVLSALKELLEACQYVAPFAAAVALNAAVKNIRHAMRFMAAVENAQAAIKAAEEA